MKLYENKVIIYVYFKVAVIIHLKKINNKRRDRITNWTFTFSASLNWNVSSTQVNIEGTKLLQSSQNIQNNIKRTGSQFLKSVLKQ